MVLMHSASTLVLGGARSGKSAFAEQLVEQCGLEAVYVATGRSFDEEMRQRIDHHQQRRESIWKTIEEPLDLVGALRAHASPQKSYIDRLSDNMGNYLMIDACDVEAESNELCAYLGIHKGAVVLVSNEVGLGIVPENKMARDFRDHAGRLHQMIGAVADEVYFVAAGLPLKMKG